MYTITHNSKRKFFNWKFRPSKTQSTLFFEPLFLPKKTYLQAQHNLDKKSTRTPHAVRTRKTYSRLPLPRVNNV
ncbi:hypothetical protein CVU75_03145 [Candidatus Dependentiae bacterium HGW-Dependentiae-1]|nr:MAG: hypothetical protein CVU75_03145 [Candidatus Dependentiae bacterium HGW-Dependentiae-1]